MNYQSINTTVVAKYMSAWNFSRALNQPINARNRKGETMFTVRPDGKAFRGNTELTVQLQCKAILSGWLTLIDGKDSARVYE